MQQTGTQSKFDTHTHTGNSFIVHQESLQHRVAKATRSTVLPISTFGVEPRLKPIMPAVLYLMQGIPGQRVLNPAISE